MTALGWIMIVMAFKVPAPSAASARKNIASGATEEEKDLAARLRGNAGKAAQCILESSEESSPDNGQGGEVEEKDKSEPAPLCKESAAARPLQSKSKESAASRASQLKGKARSQFSPGEWTDVEEDKYHQSDTDAEGEDDDEHEVDELEKSGAEEEVNNDEIIIKSEDLTGPKKCAVKGKGKGKGKACQSSPQAAGEDEDPFRPEIIKSFIYTTQQEFRLYLALENAWPCKEWTRNKYKVFQTEEFKAAFDQLWSNLKLHHDLAYKVFKVSSQYHQEIKQKAKHVVEKDFLHVKVSDWGHD
ncbi:hypothetical protein C8Q72DRAFT_828267, partial [Fomitopsis betulina]